MREICSVEKKCEKCIGQTSASGGEKSASGGEKSASGGEKSASGGEKSASGGEKSASGGEKSASGGEKSASGGSLYFSATLSGGKKSPNFAKRLAKMLDYTTAIQGTSNF